MASLDNVERATLLHASLHGCLVLRDLASAENFNINLLLFLKRFDQFEDDLLSVSITNEQI